MKFRFSPWVCTVLFVFFVTDSLQAGTSQPKEPDQAKCAEAISAAARIKQVRKQVARKKLTLRQRIIFAIRPYKVGQLIQEELHRRGIDPETCSEEELTSAVSAGYDRAWETVKSNGKRFLNGLGLTGVGATLFYLANKGLSLVMGDAQAQAGAFFLGVVGAPLVASLSASVMEVLGSALRNRSFKMKEFVSDVIDGAKPRLQELYFYTNASITSTQQHGRTNQNNLDTNFTAKIRWASEHILRYLEMAADGDEKFELPKRLRWKKAAEAVALALIKLRENFPDLMQALLTGKDETILREPKRLIGGLLHEAELDVDRFYTDVLEIIRKEDPQAANKEIADAFTQVLDRILSREGFTRKNEELNDHKETG